MPGVRMRIQFHHGVREKTGEAGVGGLAANTQTLSCITRPLVLSQTVLTPPASPPLEAHLRDCGTHYRGRLLRVCPHDAPRPETSSDSIEGRGLPAVVSRPGTPREGKTRRPRATARATGTFGTRRNDDPLVVGEDKECSKEENGECRKK